MELIVIIILAAALLSGGAAFPVVGFFAGMVLGALVMYNMGWNARGDDDTSDAIEGMRKKNAAKRR